MHQSAADAADEQRGEEFPGVAGFSSQRMLGAAWGMQPGAATVNDGIGAVPQPVAHHPQVLALPGEHAVCGVPDELRAARAELPLAELGAKVSRE
jgi:hypothetical protein